MSARGVASTLVAFSLVLGSAGSLAAQCTVSGIPGTCTLTRDITATVRKTVRLTVTPTAQVLVTPTDADYANGFSYHAGPTLDVLSNVPWQIGVRSNNASWQAAGGARINKPRADLSWGPTISGAWTAMTNTSTVFATGGATDGDVATIFYRIAWSFALDSPGTYTLNVQFTISST